MARKGVAAVGIALLLVAFGAVPMPSLGTAPTTGLMASTPSSVAVPKPSFGTVSAASLKPPTGPVPALPSGSASGSSRAWNTLAQLKSGETYTYVLTYDVSRNPQRFPADGGHGSSGGSWGASPSGPGSWGSVPGGTGSGAFGTPPVSARPGPHHKPVTTGELNFTWIRDEIRFWFEVDGVRANGTAPNDIRALAGAVLVAALTGPEPLTPEAARLLATPFQWIQWYDLFAESTFRTGLVWQVSQHPPHRLTAGLYSGRHVYWAELTRGRDAILEMGIDLREPLPWDVIAYDGWDVYRAQLVSTAEPGLRR